MKVIFCDIDGVLNTGDSHFLPEIIHDFNGLKIGFNQFRKEAVENLNVVTDFTGAKIVISSAWRIGCSTPEKFEVLKNYINSQGVTGEIIGRTPISSEYSVSTGSLVLTRPRGQEIQLWLDQHTEVTNFVIVDDMSDMEHLNEYLVQTDFENGLTTNFAFEMIKRLIK